MTTKQLAKPARKRVAKPAPRPTDEALAPNSLQVPAIEGKTRTEAVAEICVEGVAANALVADAFARPSGLGGISVQDCLMSLRGHIDRVKSGDLSGPEALLVSQAYTLNSIFTELARKAAENMGHYPDVVDRYLRLAFKAQSQSRCAIEALNEMKNPRQPVFARQANIANGPQQVNNQGDARGEQGRTPQNEL